jgi:CDP-diacylglycerol--glycerol-3-phosphate 3-phosphatidyltransferase
MEGEDISTRPWASLSWPNRITLVRVALIAPFVVLLQYQQERPVCRLLALGIFIIMALSDLLDGYLARRLNLKSRLGAIMDPLADKTLIICAAVLLSLPDACVPGARLPKLVVVFIVGKDLWVMLGFLVLFLLTGKQRILPTVAGKLCTAGQLLMVVATLLVPEVNDLGRAAGLDHAGYDIALVMWWVVGGLSVLSAVSYTRLGIIFATEYERHAHGNGPANPPAPTNADDVHR